MSAMVATELCVCGSDHLCGCGCGREVNPNLRRAHELIAAGATHREAAGVIGVTRSAVGMLLRNPPKYVKGHAVAALNAGFVRCANPRCTREFRKMGPNHLYCTYGSRREFGDERDECARLAREHKRSVFVDEDKALARRTADRVVRTAERRATIRLAALDEVALYGGDIETTAVVAGMEVRKAVGQLPVPRLKYAQSFLDDMFVAARDEVMRNFTEKATAIVAATRWRWSVKRQEQEALALVLSADEELARLVAEQEKDARFGNRVWTYGVRLDRNLEGQWGEELHELHNYIGDQALDRPVENDPLDIYVTAETQQQLRALTGGAEIEGVARLDGDSLYWLQERMRAEGLTPSGVQKAERERLQLENRHAGSSVARAGHKHGGKRTRAQQQQVTRDHHVRDLTGRQKKQHAAFRRQRMTEDER